MLTELAVPRDARYAKLIKFTDTDKCMQNATSNDEKIRYENACTRTCHTSRNCPRLTVRDFNIPAWYFFKSKRFKRSTCKIFFPQIPVGIFAYIICNYSILVFCLFNSVEHFYRELAVKCPYFWYYFIFYF